MSVDREALEQFRGRVAGRSVQEETAKQYETWIERWEAWAGEEPTVGRLIDFDEYLNDQDRVDYPWDNPRGIAKYAYQTRVKAISAIMLWSKIHYDHEITDEPQEIAEGEPSAFDPTILSRDEVQRTIEQAKDCSLGGCEAALRVSYNAILRAEEFTRIRFEDFDAEEGTLYVRAAKGSRDSTIKLDDEETILALQDHWDEYEGERKKPWYNNYGRPWKSNAWVQHFIREHNDVGTHSFGRHSPITHRLNDGEPFGAVYRRARHQSPDMTARYARLVGTDIPDWGGE